MDLKIHQCKIELLRNKIIRRYVPGASVRNSACGKGHEERGSANAKAGSSLRRPPWKFSSTYPQNQSLPTLLLCALTYTSDFTGVCPPLPLSEKRVNLQLQLIKFLGVTRVFQPTNSSEGSSGHMWLFRASQPWEAWNVLNCLNTDSFEQLKDWLEIVLVKGFSLVGPMFAAKFPYPLPTVSLAVYWLI